MIHSYIILGLAVAMTGNKEIFHAIENVLKDDPDNIIFASHCDEFFKFFKK